MGATSSPAVRAVRALWLALTLAAGLLAAERAAAQSASGLMLYPTRVILEGKARTAQIDLVNNSSEAATYRLRLVNRRMAPTGELREVTEPLPEERFADGMLRFSPRQVTLEPGASQTVRLMARKPEGLAPGEYRSHLLFERILERPAGTVAAPSAGEGVEIQLIPVISVSIPVIIREGKTDAAVTIVRPQLEPGPGPTRVLSFDLRRDGNRSVYGDLVVVHRSPDGEERNVGGARGVAVYTPNPHRHVRLAVDVPESTQAGTLVIAYRERMEEGGAIMAEAMLPVQ